MYILPIFHFDSNENINIKSSINSNRVHTKKETQCKMRFLQNLKEWADFDPTWRYGGDPKKPAKWGWSENCKY